jgi:Flp pilus assembly pilin Flp
MTRGPRRSDLGRKEAEVTFLNHLNGSESGQTTLEYGMVLVFVSIALIASLLLLAGGAQGYYQGLVDFLGGL